MTKAALHTQYPSLELAECPYPFYELLHSEAPVYRIPGSNEYLVSRHEDVLYVLAHPELFSNAAVRGSGPISGEGARSRASMIASDPPEHKPKRILGSRGFTPGRLRAYEPTIEAIADQLIDGFAERGSAEFVAEFATPLPILVFCALFFGDQREDFERFRRWALIEGSGLRYLPEERQQAARERGEGRTEYLTQAILSRHESPRDDVLSEMIQMQVERDGDLDLAYLVSEAGLLLSGGFVTTAHMLASAMQLLLEHPEEMDKVRSDRTRIKAMLEEALRVESPVQWQHRGVVADTEIAGVPIPAGSVVLVVLGAANRDAAKFACHELFDVDRDDASKHVAFGYGTHFCLGAPLARLEGRIAFERLFSRLGELRLAQPATEIRHLESTIFRGPKTLPIEFDVLPRVQ